ncbi:MAG: hypothetical protein ACM3SV_06955 [Betaproteobacteria bacterium]
MKRQRGAALLVILLIVGALAAYFAISALNSGQAERDQQTANTLAKAKEALIGFAATYRDLHANQVFGYLPCPDAANAGTAPGACGAASVSEVGHLPWNTLGLPPLRDSGGECLWYIVSGTTKDNPRFPPTNPSFVPFNWDTVGQLIIQDAATPTPVTLAGATPHERPLAILLAPRTAIGGQTRPGPASECGGSTVAAAYLESAAVSTTAGAISTITLSTSDSVKNGTNNDLGLWITSRDIFDRVIARPEFVVDVRTLMNDLAAYAASNLPAASGNKGTDTLIKDFLALNGTTTYGPTTQVRNFLDNWRDNLLYARPAGATTVNGAPCTAVLLFGGRRTPAQSRATLAEQLTPANYLEGGNATIFPGAGAYTGAADFVAATAEADLVRCVNSPATTTQVSFANDFSAFTPVGSGVTVNGASQSVGVTNGPTASGGCFWFPLAIPLAGKTMRTYYEFQFMVSDDSALTGKGNDRGNGFTFQVLNAGVGSPPATCGTEGNMGALGSSDSWGAFSFIFETDVHRDNSDADPTANHSAIMLNGTLNHSLSGTMSAACNGTAGGCIYSPANKFEELPTPALHNERIEITTGCNATCSTCDPTNHVAPNTYARLTAWVDCASCNDVTSNLDRVTKPPIMQRCVALDSSLNSFYFGFTGGFRNGSGTQGVTIRNLRLQTD